MIPKTVSDETSSDNGQHLDFVFYPIPALLKAYIGCVCSDGRRICGFDIGVYYMLSSHVTKLTKKRPQRSCFPSIATLAKELGCGKGAVRQSLLRLAEWGLICIEERHTNNAHISKLYTLPALPAIPVKIATTMELVHDNLQGGAVVVDEQDAAFQYTGEYYDLSGES